MEHNKPSATFSTGRPQLVRELMDAGYTPRVEPSLWSPNRSVWFFSCSDDLVKRVRDYYERKGITDKLPESITGWRCSDAE